MSDAEQFGLLVLVLVVALPLLSTAGDLWRRRYPRSLKNAALGFLLHALVIAMPTLLAVVGAVLAFALYPAGLFLQLMGGFDALMRLLGRPIAPDPMLCHLLEVTGPACLPTALTLHLGHLLLAGLGLRYGALLFAWVGDGLRHLREALEQALGLWG